MTKPHLEFFGVDFACPGSSPRSSSRCWHARDAWTMKARARHSQQPSTAKPSAWHSAASPAALTVGNRRA